MELPPAGGYGAKTTWITDTRGAEGGEPARADEGPGPHDVQTALMPYDHRRLRFGRNERIDEKLP
jgi:hypothetical protein